MRRASKSTTTEPSTQEGHSAPPGRAHRAVHLWGIACTGGGSPRDAPDPTIRLRPPRTKEARVRALVRSSATKIPNARDCASRDSAPLTPQHGGALGTLRARRNPSSPSVRGAPAEGAAKGRQVGYATLAWQREQARLPFARHTDLVPRAGDGHRGARREAAGTKWTQRRARSTFGGGAGALGGGAPEGAGQRGEREVHSASSAQRALCDCSDPGWPHP
jgi:hypothetical protein